MHIESRSLHHENTVIVIPQLRCFQLYSPCGELYWLRQLYLLRKLYWASPSFGGEYNITEANRLQYNFHIVKISLRHSRNITLNAQPGEIPRLGILLF